MAFEPGFDPDRWDYITSIHELTAHIIDYPDAPQDAVINGDVQLSYNPRAARYGGGTAGVQRVLGREPRLLTRHINDTTAAAWLDHGELDDADTLTRTAQRLVDEVTPGPGAADMETARVAHSNLTQHRALADIDLHERDTAIRAAYSAGISMYRIADELDMPQSTVRKIIRA